MPSGRSCPASYVREPLRPIDINNYRISFDDNDFAVIVSHQVLKHVRNYGEVRYSTKSGQSLSKRRFNTLFP